MIVRTEESGAPHHVRHINELVRHINELAFANSAEADIVDAVRRGCPLVVVLGHPAYYPRFGFAPASRHGLTCQWDGVPEEEFAP